MIIFKSASDSGVTTQVAGSITEAFVSVERGRKCVDCEGRSKANPNDAT